MARVEGSSGDPQTYFLPLSLAWEPDDDYLRTLLPLTVAKVRQQAKVGVMADAFADESFCRALVAAIAARTEIKTSKGKVRFSPTAAFERIAGDTTEPMAITHPSAQSSNTAVVLGEKLFLKAYRRLQSGSNPEVEIGRFLTDVARFANIVPVAGTIDYVADDGAFATFALLQGYVDNQGDGWITTVNYLERFLEEAPATESDPNAGASRHGGYLALMRALGMRTGELHAALSRSRGDPAFDPESITAADVGAWTKRARSEAAATLDRLERGLDTLPEGARGDASEVLGARKAILARIDAHARDRSRRRAHSHPR